MCNECEDKNNKHEEITLDNIVTPFYKLKPLNGKKNLLETHPHLIEEWDYKENDKLGIQPEEVTYGSNIKVSWICPTCNKNYDMYIYNRTGKQNQQCPYCFGHRVCLENCLATTHPKLSKQWDYENNKKLTPFDITKGSHKKVFWICPICNKSYDAIITNRTKKKNPTNCPYCVNQKVCLSNCFATLYPHLIDEFHKTKNKESTPYNIMPHSNKKYYWQCKNNKEHVWLAQISSRTRKNKPTGCPECKIYYHEIICQEIMKEVFNKEFIKYRHYLLRNNKNNYPLELDCYNEEIKINIEYDGKQHFEFYPAFHKTKQDFINQQQNDAIKDQWCLDNNILQIRVSYKYDTKEQVEAYIKEQLSAAGKCPV